MPYKIKLQKSQKHKVLTLLLALPIVAACTSTAPILVNLQAQAEPTLNRDTSGKSLSLVVHVYQLKSAEQFNRLTFDEVATGKPAEQLLGESLVKKQEMVLLPGKPIELPDQLQNETQLVGIVGFFRKPHPQYWRVLLDAKAIRKDKALKIGAGDCYVYSLNPSPVAIPGQPAWSKPDCQSNKPRSR